MLRTSFLIFLYHGGNECQINVHIDMDVYLSDTYLEQLNFNHYLRIYSRNVKQICIYCQYQYFLNCNIYTYSDLYIQAIPAMSRNFQSRIPRVYKNLLFIIIPHTVTFYSPLHNQQLAAAPLLSVGCTKWLLNNLYLYLS